MAGILATLPGAPKVPATPAAAPPPTGNAAISTTVTPSGILATLPGAPKPTALALAPAPAPAAAAPTSGVLSTLPGAPKIAPNLPQTPVASVSPTGTPAYSAYNPPETFPATQALPGTSLSDSASFKVPQQIVPPPNAKVGDVFTGSDGEQYIVTAPTVGQTLNAESGLDQPLGVAPLNSSVNESTEKKLNPGEGVSPLMIVPDTIKGIVGMETSPSQQQQDFEKMAFTPTSPAEVPLTTAGKIITRVVDPFLQPVANDVAGAIYGATDPQSAAALMQAAQGGNPDAIATLNQLGLVAKSYPQVLGDVAQAVFAFYMPELGAATAAKGADEGIATALANGAKTGAKAGAVFGTAQGLSSGTTDPYQFGTIVAQNALAGGLLGAIAEGAIPASEGAVEAATSILGGKAKPAEETATAETPENGVPKPQAAAAPETTTTSPQETGSAKPMQPEEKPPVAASKPQGIPTAEESVPEYHAQAQDGGAPQKGLEAIGKARQLLSTLDAAAKKIPEDTQLQTDEQKEILAHRDSLQQYVDKNKSYEKYFSEAAPGDVMPRGTRASKTINTAQRETYLAQYKADVLKQIKGGREIAPEVIDQFPEFGAAMKARDSANAITKAQVAGQKPNIASAAQQIFYRGGGDGSMPKSLTAADIVRYETEDLGNDIKPEPDVDLSKIPSQRLAWLTENVDDAKRYGKPVAVVQKGMKVVARDPFGGVLVDKAPETEEAGAAFQRQEIRANIPAAREFNLTKPEATQIFRGLFDDKEVDFMFRSQMIKTEDFGAREGKAYGVYHLSPEGKAMVEVVENDGKVAESVVYHEAFHAYLRNFTTRAERYDLLKSVSEDGKLTRTEAEEKLADGFAQYVTDKKASGPIRAFFQKVLLHIKSMVGGLDKVQSLYEDILNKERPQGGEQQVGSVAQGSGAGSEKPLPKTPFVSAQLRDLSATEKTSAAKIGSVIDGASKSEKIATVPGFVSPDGKDRPLNFTSEIADKIKNKHGIPTPENMAINANDADGILTNVLDLNTHKPNANRINLIKKVPVSDNYIILAAERTNGFFTITHFETIDDEARQKLKSLLGRGELFDPSGNPLPPDQFLRAPLADVSKGNSEGVSGRNDNSSLANSDSAVKPEVPTGENSAFKREEPEKIPAHLQEMALQIQIASDMLDLHPGKELAKYAATRGDNKGALPEVLGNKDGSTFGRTGDDIATEAGFEDSESARDGYQDYRNQKEALDELKASYKAQMKEWKDEAPARAADRAAKAATAEEAARPPTMKEAIAQQRAEAKARLRVYGDLESAKHIGNLNEGYYNYIAGVMKRGAEGEFAKPELNKDGNPVGKWDIPTLLDGLRQGFDGDIASGPFKGMASEAKNWFQNLVWRDRNVSIEARSMLWQLKQEITPEEFANLQRMGLQSLHDYDGVPKLTPDGSLVFKDGIQQFKVPPRRDGAFGVIARMYKEMYGDETKAGIPVREKQNYQPVRGWVPSDAVKEGEELPATPELDGRRIGLRPGFSQARYFDTHAELMRAGGFPEFPDIIANLNNRAEEHFRAMSRAQFWNEGIRSGYIIPTEVARAAKQILAHEYPGTILTTYDPDRTPGRPSSFTAFGEGTERVYNGAWMGPKPLVDLINGYLKEPTTPLERFTRGVARVAQATRNLVLSVGIPKTALTVHYFNMLPREIGADLFAGKASGAPVELAKTVAWTLHPTGAAKYIDDHLAEAMPLYRAGMLFSTEDMSARELGDEPSLLARLGGKFQTASKAWHSWFGGNFFGSFLPARMMENGLRLAEMYKGQGMNDVAAYTRAASEINNLYGNVDSASMGRDKNLQNAIRALALAPNFIENNARLGAKIVKGFAEDAHLKSPIEPGTKEYAIYAKFGYLILGTYMAANLINKETSGHWMFENDPLHQFDIDTGQVDSQGKTRYIGVVGTGADFLRLPLEIAASIAQGKEQDITTSIRDRASTVFGTLISLASNTDWQGDPIVGADKYGRPQSPMEQVANIFNNTVGTFLPGQISTLTAAAGGKQSLEQTVTGTLGFPVKYKYTGPTAATLNAASANSPKGQAYANIAPVYDKVKALMDSGDKAGAAAITAALTPTQYAAYKTYKAAQTAKQTVAAEEDILPVYQKLHAQYETDPVGAKAAYDALSTEQKKAYQLVKKRMGA